MGKKIIQIQLAWFFKSDYLGNFEEFSLKFKKKIGDSKITQHIPVPVDAPSEIPRLVLSYEKFTVNVSKNRLDLFFSNFTDIENNICLINDLVFKEENLLVHRLGLVKNFFISSNIEILKKMLPSKISTIKTREISIRINEEKTIEGIYECNNIESLSTGSIWKKDDKGVGIKEDGIILIRDINTLANKSYEFDSEKVKKIVGFFNEESDNLILLDS